MLNVKKSLSKLKKNTLLLSKRYSKKTLYLITLTLYFYSLSLSLILIYIKGTN